jgi:hypothetical protein
MLNPPSSTVSPSLRTRSTLRAGAIGIRKVALASGFDLRDILLHHHVARAGCLLEGRGAGAMVAMSMADEQDLDIGHFEAELFDARLDHGDRPIEARVYDDVALRRRDEVRREPLRADIVDVVYDFVRLKRLAPRRIALRVKHPRADYA